MIRLDIVEGREAGRGTVARRFPCRIGRSRKADIPLTDAGVWQWHATMKCAPREGVWLESVKEAPIEVNGRPYSGGPLRPGDRIRIGQACLQFWLEPPTPRSLRAYELGIVVGLGVLVGFELLLVIGLR